MMPTLDVYLEERRRWKDKHGKVAFEPVCTICVLDPDSEDAERFQCRYYRKKLRPLLDHVVGNVWVCPRCRNQHFSKDFMAKQR